MVTVSDVYQYEGYDLDGPPAHDGCECDEEEYEADGFEAAQMRAATRSYDNRILRVASGVQSMRSLRSLHLLGATGVVRSEQYEGREWLVIPVVALMDGVIHPVNAETPERVTLSTLARAATSWNGRPIVINHPTDASGNQISANDPRILSSQAIGQVFHARMAGSKLLMDAYLDPIKVLKVGGQKLLDQLKTRVCEVSVGAFVVAQDSDGVHEGKAYKAIWLEATGDHLAFLPDGKGACSVDMGCGTHRAASMHVVTESEIRTLGFVSQADRDAMDPDDFAGPHQSFPIRNQQDVDDAKMLVGHAEDPDAVKAKIISIAKRKGLLIPDAWKTRAAGGPGSGPRPGNKIDHIVAAKAHADAATAHKEAAAAHRSVSDRASLQSAQKLSETAARSSTAAEAASETAHAGVVNEKAEYRSDQAVEASGEALYESQRTNSSHAADSHDTAAYNHERASVQHSRTAKGMGKLARFSERQRGASMNEKTWRDRFKALFLKALDEAPADEAPEPDSAELISYKAMVALLTQADASLTAGHSALQAVIDGADDDATDAHLESLVAMCIQLYGTVNGVMKMATSCLAPDVDSPGNGLMGYTALRAAAGKRHNAKDQGIIQDMHDSAVQLGADCTSLKAATAGCGCQHSTEEDIMTKESRAAAIKALISNPVTGFTVEDQKALDAMPDKAIEALSKGAVAHLLAAAAASPADDIIKNKANADAALAAHAHGLNAADAMQAQKDLKKTQDAAQKAKDDAAAAPIEDDKDGKKAKAAEQKARAAASGKTLAEIEEDDYLKTAPASVRTLVTRQRTQDTARKTELVRVLKTAQTEYTEAELQAMELDGLERLARVTKAEAPVPDYSHRGAAVRPSAEENYEPLNSYDEARKLEAAATKH